MNTPNSALSHGIRQGIQADVARDPAKSEDVSVGLVHDQGKQARHDHGTAKPPQMFRDRPSKRRPPVARAMKPKRTSPVRPADQVAQQHAGHAEAQRREKVNVQPDVEEQSAKRDADRQPRPLSDPQVLVRESA